MINKIKEILKKYISLGRWVYDPIGWFKESPQLTFWSYLIFLRRYKTLSDSGKKSFNKRVSHFDNTILLTKKGTKENVPNRTLILFSYYKEGQCMYSVGRKQGSYIVNNEQKIPIEEIDKWLEVVL